MPSPNTLKKYAAHAFYHIYNRGVGKMDIFRSKQDYIIFLYYLKIIFSPVELLEQELQTLEQEFAALTTTAEVSPRQEALIKEIQIKRLRRAVHQAHRLQIYKHVELLSYCLMPNHFHLLIYQKVKDGIIKVMQRLGSAFSGYFTTEHKHVGPLFQGVYKANHLNYYPQLQALVTGYYIEQNPSTPASAEVSPRFRPKHKGIQDYPFSSLQYYIQAEQGQKIVPVWLSTARLLEIFDQIKQKPNNILEGAVTAHNTYSDFVQAELEFSLEDLRLGSLLNLA